jgi:hypothetical protein
MFYAKYTRVRVWLRHHNGALIWGIVGATSLLPALFLLSLGISEGPLDLAARVLAAGGLLVVVSLILIHDIDSRAERRKKQKFAHKAEDVSSSK